MKRLKNIKSLMTGSKQSTVAINLIFCYTKSGYSLTEPFLFRA